MPPIDRLSSLLERFRVRTQLFHAGPLCGVTSFAPEKGRGFLHVLRRGEMVVTHPSRAGVSRRITVREPSLLFYPRPLAHHFHNPPVEGSDFVCATVAFDDGEAHPLARALPALVRLPLRAVDGLEQSLALLFGETTRVQCGHRLLADRLFEVVLIQLLRWLLDHPEEGALPVGLLTGLGDPPLARLLVALHERPGDAWRLDQMAREAGLSRSALAARFKAVVGTTPADYLADWRLSIAQAELRRGAPVKAIADQLGYANASALSRLFAQRVGVSPREWLAAQQRAL